MHAAISVNSLSLKFTSIKLFTQLQHSDIPPDSEPWCSPSYPPESDSLYTELQQYPHPYRSGSQSSGYSSANLSGCSRPDDCHSLSQSRDFQGNITNNFYIFTSPIHQNTAPELNSVCMGIELRYIYCLYHLLVWKLNSEQIMTAEHNCI